MDTSSEVSQAGAGCSGAAPRGAWRSWAWRSAASRASSAARAAGPAFQSRDWRAGWVAGAAGAMGWPGFRVKWSRINGCAGRLGNEDRKLCFDGGRDQGREIQLVEEVSDGA
jgi:hypothetical protein